MTEVVKTVAVKTDADGAGGYMLINATDFQEGVHVLYEGETAAEPAHEEDVKTAEAGGTPLAEPGAGAGGDGGTPVGAAGSGQDGNSGWGGATLADVAEAPPPEGIPAPLVTIEEPKAEDKPAKGK